MTQDEPDLDAPGEALDREDQGRRRITRDYPIEQTKRANYQDLCTIMGGEDKVTRKAVEAAGLDWREWGYFVVEITSTSATCWST
ncbi:MAG: hypothetical protein M3303_05855 [Gemmatimonadota bacterium]|nr:hypothetical protein [Gemmatimonadota bacterium]